MICYIREIDGTPKRAENMENYRNIKKKMDGMKAYR